MTRGNDRPSLRRKLSQSCEEFLPMNPGQNWLEIDDRLFDYAQQELFPLDSWGTAQFFSIIDWPHEAVARAMVGPLCLGDLSESGENSAQCLAVAADGEFAACMRVAGRQLGDPRAMWVRVAGELDDANRQHGSILRVEPLG